MKRALKKIERVARDIRDDLKEAANNVKAAVDSAVLKDATSDQRKASHKIVDATKDQMQDVLASLLKTPAPGLALATAASESSTTPTTKPSGSFLVQDLNYE